MIAFLALASAFAAPAADDAVFLTVAYCPDLFSGMGAVVRVNHTDGAFTIQGKFALPSGASHALVVPRSAAGVHLAARVAVRREAEVGGVAGEQHVRAATERCHRHAEDRDAACAGALRGVLATNLNDPALLVVRRRDELRLLGLRAARTPSLALGAVALGHRLQRLA